MKRTRAWSHKIKHPRAGARLLSFAGCIFIRHSDVRNLIVTEGKFESKRLLNVKFPRTRNNRTFERFSDGLRGTFILA